MAQSDGYQIDGSKDASEYYWTGAKGEKRAYGKAYADARSSDDKKYMENVGKGGIKYIQARMKDDADWQDVKNNAKKRISNSRKSNGAAKKRKVQKTARKKVSGK